MYPLSEVCWYMHTIIQGVSKKETEIKMLILRELLRIYCKRTNILKNGNHHMLRHGVFFLLTTKLMLLSQMTEHEWFEGTLSEIALR